MLLNKKMVFRVIKRIYKVQHIYIRFFNILHKRTNDIQYTKYSIQLLAFNF